MVLNDSHLLVVMPLCNPLPMCVGWTSDLLLTNRIWLSCWNTASVIRLQEIVTSVLLIDSLYCLLGLYSFMKQYAMS